MALDTPDSATQVEERIKVDVQREAPDSDPFLDVSFLRSLIAGIARRQFDFYRDLEGAENRLFPDTDDDDAADIWGGIYIGPRNPATTATGQLVATGTAGGSIPFATVVTAAGNEYTVTIGGTISAEVISVTSITRSGSTATATTASDHGLSSFVPVTIAGADQSEYNGVQAITVTGLNTFTYQVVGTPIDATGTITAAFTTANVTVESSGTGQTTNLVLDTSLVLQSPIVNVDDTLFVTFVEVGGGSDEETTEEYNTRTLEKIRNPVAHFNVSDITAEAKTVTGVTRVFVEETMTASDTISVTSITRNVNVATVTTAVPHGYDDGQLTTITGADQAEYNVTDARVIVESTTIYHYVVFGSPAAATGTILASGQLALGQVRTFFMRDNDTPSIPTGSEVAAVKAVLDAIRPANTSSADNIVAAPVASPIDYTFTELTPNTFDMQAAIAANLGQFHDEETIVSVDVAETAYKAAIQNTVDPVSGDKIISFTLSIPSGDFAINSGEIATLGTIVFP